VDHSGRHSSDELRSCQDWFLKYSLASVPGVAEVATVGGQVRQFQVSVDPNKLAAYRIPIGAVISAVKSSNSEVGGRLVEYSGREYMVRGRGYVKTTQDLESAVLKAEGGTPIRLADVATVSLGPEMRRGLADLDGKGDVVGGIVVAKTEALHKQIRAMLIILGANMDPHQSYMVSRGLKTLALRVERAEQNAREVAPWLEAHPQIAWVRYIGLPSHPQHELAKRQMTGFGSMISFELKGGLDAGRILMNHVHLAGLAVSLGGVETLISHPASMTHASMARADRIAAGITDGLVRLSIGIEDLADILADLEQALDQVGKGATSK